MDLRLGDDLYDSFMAYQGRLLKVFDRMTDEYGFHVVDTSGSIQNVSDQIKELLEPMLVPVLAPV
jgi:thymidylate kinase